MPTIINNFADNYRQTITRREKLFTRQVFQFTCHPNINSMAIKFSVHMTPQPKGRNGEKQTHARAIARSTQRMDDICNLVCERASISSADVKAVLDSFVWVIGRTLKYGDHVELEGLGHFSPSLRTLQLPDGSLSVTLDSVNFRCSEKLKRELRTTPLERIKQETGFPPETRKNRMLKYLERNESISILRYAQLNNCSRYRATTDIRQYIKEGILDSIGSRTHRVYLLKGQTE